MTTLLDTKTLEQLRHHASQTEHPRELVIDVLQAIQRHNRWVSDEGVELAAEILGLSPVEVEEVATFYDKIYRRPVGRKVIHLCDSICCWSRGGEEIAAQIQELLHIAPGETTADGAFTLLPTCCLGACGQAPALMIGTRLYGNLDSQRLTEILALEAQEETP